MTYFSYLSEIGTIYQRLMLRRPLSSVSRGLAKAYIPPAAKVELAKKPGVQKAVMAQMSRPNIWQRYPDTLKMLGRRTARTCAGSPLWRGRKGASMSRHETR